MQRKVLRVLRSQGAEAAHRLRNGQYPVPSDAGTRWARDLYNAEIRDAMGAANAGWEAGGEILASALDDAKQIGGDEFISIDDTFGSGVSDGFVQSPTPQNVDGYFKATSKRSAGVQADKVDSIFERIKNEQLINPETGQPTLGGLRIPEIARQLQTNMNGWSQSYSRMIARTGVVWANNEGAMERYRKAHVTKKQWWTVDDDLTCPFCAGLHEEVVSIEVDYLGPGDTLTAMTTDAAGEPKEVSMRGPAWAIGHPPLHPNCRCAILPFVTEEDILNS